MRLRRVATASLLVAGLSPRPAAAPLVSRRPITELVKSADVIVVASLSSLTPVPSGFRATLAVRRTLKGEPAAAPAVEATLSQENVYSVGGDSYGLWFLSKATVPGELVVLTPIENGSGLRDAFVALPPECAPRATPRAAGELPLDRIAEELRAALKCDAPVARMGPAVEAALELVVALDSPGPAHSAVAGAVSKGGPARALATDFDAAVAALIEAEILGGRADALPREFLSALFLLADPAAAPALIRIIEALDGSAAGGANVGWAVYRGAAQALSNIHTEETLPALGRLLENDDVEIRLMAVMGVGRYANGWRSSRFGGTEPGGPAPFASSQTLRNMPAYDIFKAKPDRYVGFWRRWLTCGPCRLDLGVPVVAVKSGGDCTGTTCTIVFTADASDPDDDNFTVRWNGCEVDVTNTMECTVVAGAPEMVEVIAEVRDSYGFKQTATRQAHIYAAAHDVSQWTACGPAGFRTRTVTVSGLTLDPARAVPAPASGEDCRSR